MVSFESDYIEGALPEILDALVKTNMEQLSGYGADEYTQSAKEKIKKACNCPKAQVAFITGGTQTNQLVISTMLKQYEGVVAPQTGHVSSHEAGAIEYTGSKVITIPGHNGKMDAVELKQYLSDFYSDGNHEHMVFPGMVYISFPTEYGTIYSKKELSDIYKVTQEYKLPLFVDGARLGYGLASKQCDMTLPEFASLCDIFYIGGTKGGALCGEAIVYTKGNMPEHFENLTKKHGALLAKGRLNGIQFDTLFTDNLYFKAAEHAIEMAELVKNAFKSKGYKFLLDSPTNQQFIILENSKMQELTKKVKFCFWEKVDENHTAVRFATSWATKKENVELLQKLI
ncbi:MAG: aminotransferase class I/II-fold pyridoxal phosphate-dependent enzyme [Treponema sp.]|nr:aminotransferase class I/II-fold pyridoxal phosphate-dependent enzyme [Treponema sp.]